MNTIIIPSNTFSCSKILTLHQIAFFLCALHHLLICGYGKLALIEKFSFCGHLIKVDIFYS